MTNRKLGWSAAILMGLISGSFSTLTITLGAPRIGRNRSLDWIDIGTVLLGIDGLQAEPTWRELGAGVLVHQGADLAWAVVFFALGRRLTLTAQPRVLLMAAIPWALLTSYIEYYLLLPRLQPVVPMQVPYWTALTVHLTSAACYPLFPWIRDRISAHRESRNVSWARWTSVALGSSLAALLVFEILAVTRGEVVWPFRNPGGHTFDAAFIPKMVAHHQVGIDMAHLAVERGSTAEIRAIGRLIVAEQSGEVRLLRQWYSSWINGQMPALAPPERAEMMGLPSPAAIENLAILVGKAFDQSFTSMMIFHHDGAIMMAEEARHRGGDPRLRLFAVSLLHAQRGQIGWLRNLGP